MDDNEFYIIIVLAVQFQVSYFEKSDKLASVITYIYCTLQFLSKLRCYNV